MKWYGPEDGPVKIHCLDCGAVVIVEVTEGGGPLYHTCSFGHYTYNIEVIEEGRKKMEAAEFFQTLSMRMHRGELTELTIAEIKVQSRIVGVKSVPEAQSLKDKCLDVTFRIYPEVKSQG
jgi:hypothetical protein